MLCVDQRSWSRLSKVLANVELAGNFVYRTDWDAEHERTEKTPERGESGNAAADHL